MLPRTMSGASASTPILDTHIHLFDPTRPGGVPWPTPDDTALYKPALPGRYQTMSAKYGVVGAIAIEASSLNSDNDWLLKVVADHPIMVGMVGDLVPGSTSYMADLERLHRNPLFLGIRYGNLWDRDLYADLDKPGFVEGLKALQQANLVLDTANPDPRLIRAIVSVAERVPELRIVVDHLPHAIPPAAGPERKQYFEDLHTLAQNPHVFVKLSEIPVVSEGKLRRDPAFYQDALHTLWETFGEDRFLFGSDWPNSDHVTPFDATMEIVQQYMSSKSVAAREKYYWKNSVAAYRWRPRQPGQPSLNKR
jgi:L-fuconolactonase